MLYYGNVREDGRVIQPHEMVYSNIILNCITGLITFGGSEVFIELDDKPLDFAAFYGFIYIVYEKYTKRYTIFGDKIESKIVADFRFFCNVDGEIIDDSFHYSVIDIVYPLVSCSGCFNIKDYKQLLFVETTNVYNERLYINHNNKVCGGRNHKTITILNRFIIVEMQDELYVYDINKEVLFVGTSKIDLFKISDSITDINVFMDAIELYTNKGNYYISALKTDGLPDGWSVRPFFNMRSKSARNV
jgi:hypothetical protein